MEIVQAEANLNNMADTIRKLQRVLPISDNSLLVDEFGQYREYAEKFGWEITSVKGKLAYRTITCRINEGENG